MDDLFGLDHLLGLGGDSNQPTEEAHFVTNNLDLNTPICQEADSNLNCQNSEVQATIILGEKLGVNLTNAQELIQETIIVEGLQGVNK